MVIVFSSDGMQIYHNITTSNTNTLVTLPSVEFCVTVLGVNSIGRKGASIMRCFCESKMYHYVTNIITTEPLYISKAPRHVLCG